MTPTRATLMFSVACKNNKEFYFSLGFFKWNSAPTTERKKKKKGKKKKRKQSPSEIG